MDVAARRRQGLGGQGRRADAAPTSTIPKQWAGKADTPKVKWELARLMLLEERLRRRHAAAARGHRQRRRRRRSRCGPRRTTGSASRASKPATTPPPPTELRRGAGRRAAGDCAAEARYLRFKALEALMAQPQPTRRWRRATWRRCRTSWRRIPTTRWLARRATASASRCRRNGEFAAAIEEYAKVQRRSRLRAARPLRHAAVALRAAQGRQRPAGAQRAARRGRPGSRRRLTRRPRRWRRSRRVGRRRRCRSCRPRRRCCAPSTCRCAGRAATSRWRCCWPTSTRSSRSRQSCSRRRCGCASAALATLDRFADAEAVVKQYGAGVAGGERTEALEALADDFRQGGAAAQSRRRRAGRRGRGAHGAGPVRPGRRRQRGVKQQLAIAQLRESTNDWAGAAKIYERDAGRRPELAGRPARPGESRGGAGPDRRGAGALGSLRRQRTTRRPAWYQSEYQQARLNSPRATRPAACDRLTKLRPAMPGLTDTDLKRELNDVYAKACE